MNRIQNRPTKQAKQDETQLTQLIAGYLAYWPVLLTFLVIAVTGAYFYVRYAQVKYEATATIVIKDEKKGYEDTKELEEMNMIGTKKIIENEIEVFKSRSIMDSVVKKLRLYAKISQEGQIKTEPGYISSPILVEAANPDSLKRVKKIYLRYNQENNTVMLNNSFSCQLNEWANTPFGKLRFILNPNYRATSNTSRRSTSSPRSSSISVRIVCALSP